MDYESKYFKRSEFDAPGDPNSGLRMNPWLVKYLDELREMTGHPIIIHENGGFSFTGHIDGSYHYQGMAADFHFLWGLPFSEQARRIFNLGKFGGIGIYPEWNHPGFHVDIRSGFQIWVKRNGVYTYLF